MIFRFQDGNKPQTICCVQWLRTPHRRDSLKVRYTEICSASVDMCCNKKIIHYVNTDGYDNLRPFRPVTAVWHTDKLQELVHRYTRMHVHSQIFLLQTIYTAFRDAILELIWSVYFHLLPLKGRYISIIRRPRRLIWVYNRGKTRKNIKKPSLMICSCSHNQKLSIRSINLKNHINI